MDARDVPPVRAFEHQLSSCYNGFNVIIVEQGGPRQHSNHGGKIARDLPKNDPPIEFVQIGYVRNL